MSVQGPMQQHMQQSSQHRQHKLKQIIGGSLITSKIQNKSFGKSHYLFAKNKLNNDIYVQNLIGSLRAFDKKPPSGKLYVLTTRSVSLRGHQQKTFLRYSADIAMSVSQINVSVRKKLYWVGGRS